MDMPPRLPAPSTEHGPPIALVVDWPAVRQPPGPFVCDLLALMDEPEAARVHAHRLHLRFEGFSRPPEAIAQVRDFLRTLCQLWPWWLHFLAPDPRQWRTLLLATAPLSPVGPGQWETDQQALRGSVAAMQHALKVLHQWAGVPPEESERIQRASMAAIQRPKEAP